MSVLIIAEKPSVSTSLAYCVDAVNAVEYGNTFYREGNGYIVANALGHLIGIGMPEDYGWEKWELETLPLIPDKFRMIPIKGYGGQLKMLKELFDRDDVTEIINACDAGREGECIFRYIYNYFGCKKPVKRLWISSLTDESIKQGMKHLLKGEDKAALYEAGYTRAKADWILGMSLSRLYSIVNNDTHKVGRVKTPVLNIIASRDEEIENFTKKPIYRVLLENGAEYEKTFDTKGAAQAVVNKCMGGTAVVTSVKIDHKTENRPLLHNLTSLQREANDIYGITAADTLKAAQSLYEKKLLTYPRTDSSYLSDDMIPLVESIVKCLSDYDADRIQLLQEQGLNIDKRIIDNSKISDHHALIPTNLIGRLHDTELSENEKRIIELVINRFLCALDKPYEYDETRYEFTVNGEVFKLLQKTPTVLGWRRYVNKGGAEESESVPKYAVSCRFTAENISIVEGETTPPKHFTEGMLLWVMENIDRLIEDKVLKGYVKERGLGTPATRAAIIEELIAAGYVRREKKLLISTDYGREFVGSLPEAVKSPDLTAHWELMLGDIEKGKVKSNVLLDEIVEIIRNTIDCEKAVKERVPVTRKHELGKCPRCGTPIYESAKTYYCSAGRDKCGFFLFKNDKRIGRAFTARELTELLVNGRATFNNCIFSKGNKYSAVFSLEEKDGYVNLKLEEFIGDRKGKKDTP
ncbi:MAG: type IA DNA topoisomerase [Ruminiclostridium sp.]|nr:type IA DNA topoisomerase [Ruminiclostridium sp.]